jgi:hypothetical protein
MRIITLLLAMLLSLTGYSQDGPCRWTKRGAPNTIDSSNQQTWLRAVQMPLVGRVSSCHDSTNLVYLSAGGTWYRHTGAGGGFVAISGGGGGSVIAGRYIIKSGDSISVDTATLLANSFASPNNWQAPTTAAVNGLLSEYATVDSLDSVAGLIPVGAVDSVTLADSTAAVRAAIPSVTGFVPYTGANSNVNLGTFGILARKFTGDTMQASGSMGIHIHGTGGTGIMVGAGGGGNITFDAYPTTVAGDSVLTTNGSGGLLRYNLKSKLANYLLVADTGVYVATRFWVQSQGYGTGTIRAITGDLTASGTGTVTGTLATVNSSPATYTNATVTVDSKGRVTSASSGTTPVTSVSGTSGRVSSTGGTTPVVDLVTVNATPATYGSATAIPVVTVDAYGRATTITTTNPSVTATNTATLTNKRITYRTGGAASYTTSVTIAADSVDMFVITAQTTALLFNAPSGTPTQGQMLLIRIKDNGTARALTWNAIWRSGTTVTLPTTTVLSKTLYMEFLYNQTDDKWDIVGVANGY